MSRPRVLSGIQPTGNLHLGNYLGAIRNWVALQDSHECLYMLADLHAITVFQDPAELTKNTREIAAALIASGIDPKKSVIFPQSAVSAHSELAWILGCHTSMGWLNRMTQFKEKRVGFKFKKGIDDKKRAELLAAINKIFFTDQSKAIINLREDVSDELRNEFLEMIEKIVTPDSSLGLFAYPTLMAADILGYHATHVPVGADQKQHLELAQQIAGAFNRAYKKDFFPIPKPIILPTAARIMSLADGTKKMSKSDPSDYSRITLTDDADAITKKIKKAQSDSEPTITLDEEKRPALANLLTIYAALSDSTPQQAAEHFAGKNFGALKSELADLAVAKLSPITARMRELMQDTATLDNILTDGAVKANAIAQPILKEAMAHVGFLKV